RVVGMLRRVESPATGPDSIPPTPADAGTESGGGIDPALLDLDALEELQRELDAIQKALDELAAIPPTTSATDDPADRIRRLAVPFEERSDLVGDGDIVTFEQVDTVAEVVPAAVVGGEPSAAEVGDAVPAGAEALLDAHDDAAVGDADDVGAGEPVHDGVE